MTEQENLNEVAQIINIRTGIVGEKKAKPEMSQLLREAATESIVLLKNNGVLPLKNKAKLAVFGRSQIDYFFVGYGSGGEVNPPYTVNVIEGLQQKEVSINEALLAKYQAFCKENFMPEMPWGMWPRSLAELHLDLSEIKTAQLDDEVAILVIGRAAGEDRENLLEAGSYYLTDEEKALVDNVTKAYEKVVLIINSGNILDLSWIENYDFAAILFAWQGGMESGNAIADVLMGDANPSGKLSDTIARNYDDYPGNDQFGQEEYSEYIEDVYVGYRYFETFHPEKVLYPFGFGLSYTTFSQQTTMTNTSDEVKLVTTVTNNGTVAGKEVIQVYVEPPQGLLGKPTRNLVKFAKTRTLAPGESEVVEFQIPMTEFASYDDSGVTGHQSSYVLEAGDYQLFVGNAINHLEKVGVVQLDQLQVVETLTQLSAPETQFSILKPELKAGKLVESYQPVTLQKVSVKERILSKVASLETPSDVEQFLNTGKTIGELVSSLTEIELDAITRGEGKMDSPMGPRGNAGMLGGTVESLREKGIPTVITTDGPAGIRLNHYASLLPCGTGLACTWNTELVEQLADEYGKEMVEIGSDVILAPGMNIHRNPLGGRNFEYFSEDPYLTGKMAASYVRGVQANGVAACPKHYACNNQETNRTFNDSRVSERALREIYLKGFEICVKEANPYSIMTSYNKINGVWAHYHYDLVTAILREEWGFDGCVMTDWWMRMAQDPNFEQLENNAYRVRAQVDVLMPGGLDFETFECDDSLVNSLSHPEGLKLTEAQRSAYNVLKFIQRIK